MPIGREPLRLLYLTAGLACVGLGVLGMFLPVLPTIVDGSGEKKSMGQE